MSRTTPECWPYVSAAAPAFDLASLDLSLYLKAGASFHESIGGTTHWDGSASAGNSANVMGYYSAVRGFVNGPVLDGQQTAASIGALIGQGTLTTALQASPATPVLGSDLVTASTGSHWFLLYLPSASVQAGSPAYILSLAPGGSNTCVLGSNQVGGFAGAGPAHFKLGMTWGGFTWGFTIGDAPLDQWFVLQCRVAAGVMQMRVNGGAWSGAAVTGPATLTDVPAFGNVGGPGVKGYFANVGVSKTRYDDATFDNIYAGLRSLYPSAGLP